jgi:hypothetical protein
VDLKEIYTSFVMVAFESDVGAENGFIEGTGTGIE